MKAITETAFKETEAGKIPADWNVFSIGSVAKVIGGTTPSTKIPDNFSGGICWITPKDLSNYQFRYISSGERNITKKGMESCSLQMLPKGAVLLTTRAPVGYVAIANNEMTTNQGFRNLIPNEKATSEFLYYLLKFNTNRLKANASGTTFGELSGSTLKSLTFGFPSREEQTAITKILSDLDSKIELNQQMNKTLEAIAKSIFKQWFIDFEFPNEEGKPYKSSGGEMIYNEELGKEIPKGWELLAMNDIAENFDSKRIPLSSRERESRKSLFRYYGATGILDCVDDFIFDGIYVLMGEDGSVINERGRPILQYVWGKFWVNNHAHVLRGKKMSNELLYLYLQNTTVGHIVTGAVQPKINQNNMNKLTFVLPERNVMPLLESILGSLFAKVRANSENSDNLSEIRDSLLPKLMSGKIRVPIEARKIC